MYTKVQRAEASDLLELESRAVGSCLTWVLGIKLRPLKAQLLTLSHLPSPKALVINMSYINYYK